MYEPLRKFLKIYVDVNEAVKTHDKAVAEYAKAKERREKLNRGAPDDAKVDKVSNHKSVKRKCERGGRKKRLQHTGRHREDTYCM